MDKSLEQKFHEAMNQVASRYPVEGTSARETVEQTRARINKAEEILPEIRRRFTSEDMKELREHLKEIDPGNIPISPRSNVQAEVEATPWNFTYEYYFLKKLLMS